jgi:hypothetical protein
MNLRTISFDPSNYAMNSLLEVMQRHRLPFVSCFHPTIPPVTLWWTDKHVALVRFRIPPLPISGLIVPMLPMDSRVIRSPAFPSFKPVIVRWMEWIATYVVAMFRSFQVVTILRYPSMDLVIRLPVPGYPLPTRTINYPQENAPKQPLSPLPNVVFTNGTCDLPVGYFKGT